MWLIVGLGNPGSRYEKTRHNVGFHLVDFIGRGLTFKSEHKALVTRTQIGSEPVLLAKPQTFMNLSGESVQPLMHFYKIEIDKLVVVHDEVDLPFARLKIQKNRSSGGHNGLKSINQMLATQDYARIRMGVGRPETLMDTADFVLQNFSGDEFKVMGEYLDRTAKAVETLVTKGIGAAASLFNQTPSEKI